MESGGGDQSGLVKKRSDTVSYALLAEVNSFHEQRVKDIKSSHQHFLQEQIKFYQKVRISSSINNNTASNIGFISDHREAPRDSENV